MAHVQSFLSQIYRMMSGLHVLTREFVHIKKHDLEEMFPNLTKDPWSFVLFQPANGVILDKNMIFLRENIHSPAHGVVMTESHVHKAVTCLQNARQYITRLENKECISSRTEDTGERDHALEKRGNCFFCQQPLTLFLKRAGERCCGRCLEAKIQQLPAQESGTLEQNHKIWTLAGEMARQCEPNESKLWSKSFQQHMEKSRNAYWFQWLQELVQQTIHSSSTSSSHRPNPEKEIQILVQAVCNVLGEKSVLNYCFQQALGEQFNEGHRQIWWSLGVRFLLFNRVFDTIPSTGLRYDHSLFLKCPTIKETQSIVASSKHVVVAVSASSPSSCSLSTQEAVRILQPWLEDDAPWIDDDPIHTKAPDPDQKTQKAQVPLDLQMRKTQKPVKDKPCQVQDKKAMAAFKELETLKKQFSSETHDDSKSSKTDKIEKSDSSALTQSPLTDSASVLSLGSSSQKRSAERSLLSSVPKRQMTHQASKNDKDTDQGTQDSLLTLHLSLTPRPLVPSRLQSQLQSQSQSQLQPHSSSIASLSLSLPSFSLPSSSSYTPAAPCQKESEEFNCLPSPFLESTSKEPESLSGEMDYAQPRD